MKRIYFRKMVELSQDKQDQRQQDDQDQGNRIVFPLKFSPLDEYTQETETLRDGSNGIVFYKAVHNQTSSIVTIKRIPASNFEEKIGIPIEVLNEVTILKELSHPNIVTLIDVDMRQKDNFFFFIFESFLAQDLTTFIDSHQRGSTASEEEEERVGLNPLTIRSFMTQLLTGLAFCHEHGVLHRNLQPKHVRYEFS